MKISEKKVVALTYTLTVDGQVADQTTEDRPLDFIFGMGYLLPKFEENIAARWTARFRKASSPWAT